MLSFCKRNMQIVTIFLFLFGRLSVELVPIHIQSTFMSYSKLSICKTKTHDNIKGAPYSSIDRVGGPFTGSGTPSGVSRLKCGQWSFAKCHPLCLKKEIILTPNNKTKYCGFKKKKKKYLCENHIWVHCPFLLYLLEQAFTCMLNYCWSF